MKFALKKYIYILNDATNMLLHKDRVAEQSKVKKLTFAVVVIALLLAASLLFNVYLATGA